MPISSYWNMGNKIKIVSTMLDGNKQTHEIREYEQVKLFCKGDWYCYPHWELQLWFWNWTQVLLHIWHTGSLYFTEHTCSDLNTANPTILSYCFQIYPVRFVIFNKFNINTRYAKEKVWQMWQYAIRIVRYSHHLKI